MVRAGIARVDIVDDGTVEMTDLHRQSLYGECDLGRSKARVARERLLAINSEVEVVAHEARIERNLPVPSDCRIVVDCLDNFSSRFDLYAATPPGSYFVHGGVQGDRGQVLTLIKEGSQPLEQIYAGSRQPDGPIEVTPYGVFVIAGMMCSELCNIIGGMPKLLDRFLVVDLGDLTLSFLDV